MSSSHENAPHVPDQEGEYKRVERRVVISTLGAMLFSFSVIGAFGGEAGAQPTPAQGVPPACTEGDSACPGPDGDCDARGPLITGRDASCGSGETDEACELVSGTSPSTASVDTDENCGSGDRDQACGDCDDHHDTDENCNVGMEDGKKDKDELCGHAHYVSGDNDNTCSKTDTDEGCGDHDTTYNPDTFNDTDEHCAKGPGAPTAGTTHDSDQNCASQSSDQTCNAGSPSFSSSPDENCSTTDTDEACGSAGSTHSNPSYDDDESCSSSSADESCGGTEFNILCNEWTNTSTDENSP